MAELMAERHSKYWPNPRRGLPCLARATAARFVATRAPMASTRCWPTTQAGSKRRWSPAPEKPKVGLGTAQRPATPW